MGNVEVELDWFVVLNASFWQFLLSKCYRAGSINFYFTMMIIHTLSYMFCSASFSELIDTLK